MFLRRHRRKNDFGVRRKEREVRGVLFSVRDIDVLRLLCWCQNIKPNSLNGVSTKEERENLMTMGFIKTHERSGTLLLTNKGRAFVELLLNGVIPGLRISYHDAAIERRLRLSELVLTAYYAGVDVFTTSVGGDGREAVTSYYLDHTKSRTQSMGQRTSRRHRPFRRHLLCRALCLSRHRAHGSQR